jgi:hypothetical protein
MFFFNHHTNTLSVRYVFNVYSLLESLCSSIMCAVTLWNFQLPVTQSFHAIVWMHPVRFPKNDLKRTKEKNGTYWRPGFN